MKLPRRPVLLALLALTLPLPALAVSGNQTPAGPVSLGVSTTLGGCGTSGSQVVCELNVSFKPLDNADAYTASVTRADGSVVDYGTVPAGGATLHVPYVGAGTYTVTITAYGDPEEPGGPKEKIASETSAADGSKDEHAKSDGEAKVDGEEQADDPAAAGGSANDDSEESAADGQGQAEAEGCVPPPAVPPAPEPPPPDNDPDDPDEDADGVPDAQEAAEYERLLAEREQALEAASQASGC